MIRLILLLILLLLLLLTLPACGPASITFALGGSDPALHERTVIDEGWGPKIAQIDVRGLLIDSPRPTLLGTTDSPVDDLVARLDKAAKDPDIRAVILRINSPGGGVAASETMYAEVRRFRRESGKPVVASLGEVAASGGYYLALAADEVVAQPTTITGSIGVIIPTVNISSALNRWGVHSRSITSGPNKDMANPLEPAEEPHYALLQGMVDEFYTQFRALVTERRSPAIAAATGADAQATLDTHTDGRVFTGAQAARLGFADGTGGLRDAFDRAKSLANLPKASLVRYHSEGDAPRTAYARADNGSGDINLLKIDAGEALLGMPPTGGGAYYLWTPGRTVTSTDPCPPPADGDADEMVALAYAPHPISAHLLCSVLDGLGIRSAVLGEHSAANITFFSPVGTTSIHVRRADYERAVTGLTELLENVGALKPDHAPPRCLACGYDMRGIEKQERCPECGTAWSALARLRHTISLAPVPAAPGAQSTVQRIGISLGWWMSIAIAATILALCLWLASSI